MRGDGLWNAETYEAVTMSSLQGLPARGSDASILITRVHLHPHCELVEFWAKFSQEEAADYLSLAKAIQSPGIIFREFEGNPGDQCLAQKDGTWYRARIVSQNGSQYVVFLVDKGLTYSINTSMLAWGKKEYFYMPPEVEFCVLANVLPVSPDNRWSPVALEFLKSLTGRSVKIHVQNFLMLHRMFVLHIPCISKQMYEMGFARKLSPEMFQDFLLASLQCKSEPTLLPEPQSVTSVEMGERLHKKDMFMYPELQAGTVETVVVTEVTSPQRIFCQLKVFSQELKKLSEQLAQCYDGRTATCTIGPEMIGFPCAARGSDGKWYRSVLQQVFHANKVVEVLNVDYGTKQIVQVENVRPLASEFFRMPVVTYSCALHRVIDQGVGWMTSQIDYLRTLLLFKTIITKFEYQSITEGVYYVTLYGDENSNINDLFGSKESCLLQCEKILGNYAICASGQRRNNILLPLRQKGEIDDNKRRLHSQLLPVENLPVDSAHVAFVQYVSTPSEFWIQTQNFAKELDELTDKMANLYQNDLPADVVKNPTVGLYCAAKAKDGEYYRAIVTEVGSAKVKVFFVDYGNSEAVNSCCIKTLREEFKKLPRLALKCTLAGVRSKGREWSQEACELFIKIVLDKALNVQVTVKADGCHFVHLTDPDAQGEKDLAKLLCAAGFAEKDETKIPSKGKTSSQFALPSTAQYTRTSFLPQYSVVSGGNERKCATFKEQMFSIGSILDVNVSYIESPNDFWCQSVQSSGHLKLLMYDMQTYYRNSEFQPLVEAACVARHPDNGMWYRALIVHKHETPVVDVLFIDYGQTETVSVFDLRRIEKDFVSLPGQAFRCSLFNPVDPTSANNDWTNEAVDRFHTFVEAAANSFVILKCTIYAVMYSEQKIVFNIVDLETPFESICTSLVNLVKSAPSKAPSGPSFRLDTYYYSTHNVKTGTEEQVTLTSVRDVSHFYCQLQRNADVLEDLQLKVASLCEQLQRVNIPPVFGTLCFAKYTDGHWYRGQIKATKPSIMVHFVDYGDTLEVEKSDLLPIPKEASEIMAVPVQALLCSLSDVPDDIPQKANSWFETSSTACEFKALIVAKEPDGKLVVELYQGKIQVNSKIKKLFEITMHTEGPVVCQDNMPFELTKKPAQKSTNASSTQALVELDDTRHNTKDTISFVPKPSQPKNAADTVEKKMRPSSKPRQLYKPPHQRELNGKVANETSKCTEGPPQSKQKDRDSLLQIKLNKPDTSQQLSSPATESWIKDDDVPPPKIEKLPKLSDLPPRSNTITNGMVTEVYISHCNSPLSFYVQLVKEEEDIFSIVDKLNDPETASKFSAITEVHPGDLVQAEFTADSSLYRAVVKEKQDKATALVQFVDFGNTASLPLSKMSKLDKSFLQHPVYSTHCMLKGAAGLEKDEVLEPEVLLAFESAIGNVEKQLKCKFIQLSGTVWEVVLENDGVEVEYKISVKSQPDDTQVSKVKKASSTARVADSCFLQFKQQEFQEGQQLNVYITAITDAQIFWCQSADSEELDQISESLAEAGDSADSVNLESLSLGSPCIALYSEDQLWYRAEVLNKTEDKVSLFFVDYGDKSQVKLSNVRPITPEMIKNPVQAFLCELEGFKSLEGSWETSAEDELSALTADQLLQLTVCKVTREDGKPKCYVRLESEGEVINESMKKFWKSNASEVVLDKSETSIETIEAVPHEKLKDVVSCDDYGAEVPSVERGEIIEVLEDQTGTTASGSQFSEDHKEPSEFVVEEEEGHILTNDAQVGPENSLVSYFAPSEEAEDQMCSTSSGSQILESHEVNISAITMEPSDASLFDIAFEETVLYCTGDESEDLSSSYEGILMDKDLKEQDLSIIDSTGTEDMGSPLDVCFLELTDESGFIESFNSPCKEARHDSDIGKYFDANQEPENPEMFISEAHPARATTARLVPCLFLDPMGKISPEHETANEHLEGSRQCEDLLVVPSSVLLQDSFDSDLDAETPVVVIPGTKDSPSVTSARMVPRAELSPTMTICPDEIPDEAPVELQQVQLKLLMSENLLLLPSCDNMHQHSSNLDQETPGVISDTTTASSSVPMNEDLLPLPTNDIASQDSLDGETSEKCDPETSASVTSVKTNEDVLIFPSNEVSFQSSTDLDHNDETHDDPMIIKSTSTSSTSAHIMCDDMLQLALSVALPHDAFDLELETETADISAPETTSTSSSVSLSEDLLLAPTSDLTSPDSLVLDQDAGTLEEVALEMSSASVTSMEMNEVLLMFPSVNITSQDSLGLDEETETPDVMIQEPATASMISTETCGDEFPLNVPLPLDSFGSDDDTETAEDEQLLILPTCDVLPENLTMSLAEFTEQEFDTEAAGDGLCQSCKDESTSAKTDRASELLTHCEDLLASHDVAATESQAHTVTVPEKGEEVKTDENIESLSLSDASHFRSVTEVEATDERPPSVEVPCGQLIVLDDVEKGAEPEPCFFSSSHLQMTEQAEHMRCLVEEVICAGEEPAAQCVSSESLEDPVSEDSSDDTLTEEFLLEDSLESQLSRVTRLSLIVEDDSLLDNQSEDTKSSHC